MSTLQASREQVEGAIEQLIALLDRLDGNPDDEANADDELSLGSTEHASQWPPCMTGHDDRELDASDDEPYLAHWSSTPNHVLDAEFDVGDDEGPGLVAGGQGL